MKLQYQVISEIIHVAANNDDIAVIWLYGSRAMGSSTEQSDYDLAIAFKNFELSATGKFLRPNELALIWSDDFKLPANLLSVVDINLVPIYLAFNIVEYGEIIYQTKTSRSFKEQNRIYSQYEYQMIESIRNE
ncbi:MAG: nucleotidyltransferase domain-containing protein [Colwellia sp.]|nr:nucleotidyltransferase domain-containing protein [Colwellia sp.]